MEEESVCGSRNTGYSDLSLGECSSAHFSAGAMPEPSMRKGWVRAGDFLVREEEWMDIDVSQHWTLAFRDQDMERGCVQII